MNSLRLFFLPVLLFTGLSFSPLQSDTSSITYELDARDPSKNAVQITMKIKNIQDPSLTLAIPAWMPGAYRIGDFHKEIKDVQAGDANGKILDVTPLDHQTWMVQTGKSPEVTVTYRRTLTKEYFNKDHCYMQGPATFLYVKGHLDIPHRATFLIPEDWKIATGLDPIEKSSPPTYTARDYDTFADCPIELGKFTLKEFTYKDALYQVVIHGTIDYDLDKFVEVVRKIVAWQVDLFQDTPYKRYVFIYHIDSMTTGGGLEHLNSTTISLDSGRLKTGDYSYHAGITAHEFFHLWNVKRIRPKVLGPFDYSKDVRTHALWFCEGVTDYYATVTLVRAGIWDEEKFLKNLSREIAALTNNPDRKVTSVEKASWTVWDQRDGPRISYYTKGLLVGCLLDLQMRLKTDNRKTLDDVMVFLHRWFVKEGKGPIGEGFEETDLKRAVHAISGHDFSEFFERYLSGTVDLPLEETLKDIGYRLQLDKVASPWVGVYRSGSYIYAIEKGTPAEKTGFKYGDRIVGINGKDVPRPQVDEEFNKFKDGDEVTLKVRRGDEHLEAKVKVTMRETLECSIKSAEAMTDLQKKIRLSWLTGK